MVDNEGRLALVERRTEDLLERLERVEAKMGRATVPPARPERPVVWRPPATAPAGWTPVAREVAKTAAQAPSKVAPAVHRPGLEDLLAGRVLAWAGGVAVLVGIVLLFAIAVSRGWIGEELRTLFGALTSFTLVAAGAWLHEHRGRTDAALAATSAGIAGLFAASFVAARHYELIPLPAGVVLALATGVVATSLAVRWETQGLAALGILGGLAAPVVIGGDGGDGGLVLLFVATLSAAAVCVRFGWEWIAGAAFVITALQWIAWVAGEPPHTNALACLVAFGAVNVAMAVGFEIRRRSDAVRPVAVLVLALNAFVLAGSGWYGLGESVAWLGALGVAHVVLGLALLRGSRAVALLACALGVVLLDIALGQVLSGVVLAFAWAGVAAAFAPIILRSRAGSLTEGAVGAGLGGHLTLALGHALAFEAPPETTVGAAGVASLEATAVIATIAAACFVSGRVLADRSPWRMGLDAIGLAAVGYLAAINLDGATLVAVLAAEAVVLAEIARRRSDPVAIAGAAAFTAIALGHAITIEAPPQALLDGSADLVAAAIALVAGALAAWRCAAMAEREAAVLAYATSAVAVLHLASISVVTAAGAGPRAQALLSVLWGVVGVVALVAGLIRDVPAWRTGALWLLLAALAKVFLYDLATLTPMARVASFIVLGLLLLLGAFAWQRIRPRPMPDLREVPPGLRG